jgi:adenylosuccinate lyase
MAAFWSEEAKFQSWLDVELAACRSWNKRGAIPDDALKIIEEKAAFSVERIEEIEAEVRHDVIAFTTALAENIGPESRYVHLGLTSSDVTDTAQALRCVRAFELIMQAHDAYEAALKKVALDHKNTVMVGRTHGIHGEPITLGIKACLWLEQARRDRKRLEAAREAIRVGKISGAVGTFAHTGPGIEEDVCADLGLIPDRVSNQVLQRDRHAEVLSAFAIAGAGIERIALEIRCLQRSEVQEIFEPFGRGQKGSSAMPHKKNPVTCEQLCGLSRILRSNLQAALENIALWHERDISHSSVERVILPDSFMLLHYMLVKITWVLEGMQVRADKMQRNLMMTHGLVFSQKILLELIDKTEITREDAYKIVQRNALKTWDDGTPLRENLLADDEFTQYLDADALDAIMDVTQYLKYTDDIYKRCEIG